MFKMIFVVCVSVLLSDAVLAGEGIKIPSMVQSSGVASDVSSITDGIAKVLYVIAGAIAVIALIIGGIKILMDEADAGYKIIKNVMLGGTLIAIVGGLVHVFG